MAAQRDHKKLFDLILSSAMAITGCDAGTLYMYDGDKLNFVIMRNNTLNTYLGGLGEPIGLPPVELKEENVCAYTAIHNHLVNIADVYNCKEFDFSGPRRYDAMTGYKTTSMLVVPLQNNQDELNGVLQLMNAQDGDGNVIEFDKELHKVVQSLASQAAIAITNLEYTREIKDLLNSVIELLAAAIDERSPYNANHTRNVAKYTKLLAQDINERAAHNDQDPPISDSDMEQLVMAAYLHDAGKIATPLEIMDKATRLDSKLKDIEYRFEKITLIAKLRMHEGAISAAECDAIVAEAAEALALIKTANSAGFNPPETIERIKQLGEKKYIDTDATEKPWLTQDELYNLLIVRGTLTPEERKVIESHVILTGKLLRKIKFSKHYSKVTRWAESHHERVDGKGYPNKIGGSDLDIEMRLLAVIDVFDALTADDRPYKQPMPPEKALSILYKMSEEGALDKDIIDILQESRIWEKKSESSE